jgi:hypothetical protein
MVNKTIRILRNNGEMLISGIEKRVLICIQIIHIRIVVAIPVGPEPKILLYLSTIFNKYNFTIHK